MENYQKEVEELLLWFTLVDLRIVKARTGTEANLMLFPGEGTQWRGAPEPVASTSSR